MQGSNCANMIIDFGVMVSEFKFKDKFEHELKSEGLQDIVFVTGSAVGELFLDVYGPNIQGTVNKLKKFAGVKNVRAERRTKFEMAEHKIVYPLPSKAS